MTNDIPIYDIRRDFDENLYVEREKEFEEAQGWQHSNKRVLTITSPPAQGKSWFLAYFFQFLTGEDHPAFFVDIVNFLKPGPLGTRDIDETALQQWLYNFTVALHEKCSATPSLNDAAETASNLTTLAKHVSQQCWPSQSIYLFVDGGDEPSKEAFKKIIREILEPIMTHQNWRLIITVRQEQRILSSLLNNTEKRLTLAPLAPTDTADTHQGYEQLDKLIDKEVCSVPQTGQIIALFPDYSWSHTGLNTFLYEEAKEILAEGGVPQFRKHLLERGVSALTGVENLSEVSALVHWLKSIDQMKANPEWTREDLATFLSLPLSGVWGEINLLLKHLLIVNLGNRYKITDGVREFVRAASSLG